MKHAARACVGLLAAAAVCAALPGCGGDIPLGAVPGLIFWAGAESGDNSEWAAGDAGGTAFTERLGQVEVVNAPVRRGAHSFLTIINVLNETLTQATLFRNGPFPAEAYYSAWFRLGEPHRTAYWAIMKIMAAMDASYAVPALNVWDLVLDSNTPDGTLTLFLNDHQTNETKARSTMPVPIGRWFHVEMFLKAAADATGRVAVWQDGVPVLEIHDYATAPTDFLLFGVGNIADSITPPLATIEIDDAAVSLQRLGP